MGKKQKVYVVTVKLRIKAEHEGDAIADAHTAMAGAVVQAARNPGLDSRWISYGVKREAKCLS